LHCDASFPIAPSFGPVFFFLARNGPANYDFASFVQELFYLSPSRPAGDSSFCRPPSSLAPRSPPVPSILVAFKTTRRRSFCLARKSSSVGLNCFRNDFFLSGGAEARLSAPLERGFAAGLAFVRTSHPLERTRFLLRYSRPLLYWSGTYSAPFHGSRPLPVPAVHLRTSDLDFFWVAIERVVRLR